MRNKKGQNAVEYIIIFAAVIAALMVFLGPAGPFRGALMNVFEGHTTQIENLSATFIFCGAGGR